MANLTVWRLRAETTTEWVGALTMTDQLGALVTAYTLSLVPQGGVASVFTSPVILGGAQGIAVGSLTAWPLARGKRYTIVGRYAASPGQVPLVDLGIIVAV